MPGLPSREDDDDAPLRSGSARPHAVSSTDQDERHPAAPRRRAPAPAPRTPAFEGLTTTGAGVVGLLGTTLFATVDALVSPGPGWIFFIGFFAMSAFVGLRLRGSDAWASVAVPPLVFISAAGIAAQVAPVAEGGWVRRTSGDMASAVLDHPFMLLIGTGLAVVAFAYRAAVD